MAEAYRLVMLPGVGADHRLFEPQRAALPNLEVPDWLSAQRNESLPHYAARMAETIAGDRPLVLGGVSFGGMVAYEMARALKPDSLVLISTARSRRALRPIYRMIRPFMPLLPPLLLEVAKPLASPSLALVRSLNTDARRLGAAMFRDADSRFMHWAFSAIFDWRPVPLEGIAVRQIHGLCDGLLPARRSDADVFVPGAGHLMNVTHAEVVNAFIREAVSG